MRARSAIEFACVSRLLTGVFTQIFLRPGGVPILPHAHGNVHKFSKKNFPQKNLPKV